MQDAIFKLTPEMESEINDQIGRIAEDVKGPDDSVRDRPRSVSIRRRNVGMENIRSTAPGPEEHPEMVEEMLEDRRQTHGNFRDNARFSQRLKATFRSTAAWEHLDDVEKESLDMIALKISRILSGKSLERQHWEDVEGYAALARKECDE